MRWMKNPRTKYWGLAIVGAMLSVTAWCALPPQYDFDFSSRTSDRDDVFALTALANDLLQIQQWEPQFVDPDAIEKLAAWITYPSNAEALTVRELRVDNSKRMTTINGQLLLLDGTGEGSLAGLRELTRAELTAELQKRLEKCRDRRCDVSFAKIVALPGYRRLLERCGCPGFPVLSNPARAIFTMITGSRLSDRERWVESFRAAVDRDIAPRARQYMAMDRRNVVSVEMAGPGTLLLHKRQDASVPGTIYSGIDSISDFDVRWLPDEPHGGPSRAHDTGIRYVRAKWIKADEDKWLPQWPPDPQQLACRTDRLKSMLQEYGLPRKLVVTSGLLSVSGEARSSKVWLHAGLSSDDFPNWQSSLKLSLSGQSSESFRRELIRQIGVQERKLLEHAAQQTVLCGLPTKFTPAKDRDRSLNATIRHPQFGSLKFRCSLGRDGRFGWEPELDLQDKVRIIESLTRARPSLAGLESRLVLAYISVEPSRGEIGLDFRLNPQKGEATVDSPIQWKLHGLGAEDSVVLVPAEVPVITGASAPADGVEVTSQTREELAAEVNRILKEDYPGLFGALRVCSSLRTGGVEVRLNLQIADWKALTLGPALVSSVDQVRAVLKSLLGSDSVIAASRSQWKACGPIHNPRYGLVTAEVAEWSPQIPRAKIHCGMQLKHLGTIDWFDDEQLNGQRWTRLNDALLADRIEQQVSAGLHLLHRLVSTFIPADCISLSLDQTGIEGRTWLDLDPPRIALRGEARLPGWGRKFPPMKLAGIILDADGLHTPEEFGFAVPATMPLGHAAISEPYIMISLSNPSLRLGGKVTPPIPPIALVHNPWLHVAYANTSVRGFWERVQLEGHCSLALVGTPDVAQGMASVNFTKQSLMAELRAGGRLPGLPSFPVRFGGRLEASAATKTIEVETRAQLFDEDAAALMLTIGNMEQRPRVDPLRITNPAFGIQGHVGVPLIAKVSVIGEADAELEHYTIHGNGSVGPFACYLTATEREVRMEKEFRTKLGAVYWDEWGPNLVTVNRPDPDDTFGVGMQPGLSGRTFTIPEQAFAERNLTPPGHEESPTQQETDISRAVSYQLISEFVLTDDYLQAMRHGSLVAAIPRSQLPERSLGSWKAYVWLAANGSGHALIIHKTELKARHIEFSDIWTITSVRDLPPPAVPLQSRAEQQTAMRACQRHFRLQVLDAGRIVEMTEPEPLASGNLLAFEYRLASDPDSPILAVFGENTQPGEGERSTFTLDVHLSIAGLNGLRNAVDEELQSMLTEQRPAHAVARLIAVDRQARALGWYIANSREETGATVMVTQSENAVSRTFTMKAPESTLIQRLQWANLLTRAAISRPRLARGQAWFGELGSLVEAKDVLWIIRDRGDHRPQVDALPRSAFDIWRSQSSNKLPPDWKSHDLRRGLSAKDIALTALADRFAQADRRVEPVNRLGLLQTLAREQESSPQ